MKIFCPICREKVWKIYGFIYYCEHCHKQLFLAEEKLGSYKNTALEVGK